MQESSLTKENARQFSFSRTKFSSSGEIERKLILGKNHHTQGRAEFDDDVPTRQWNFRTAENLALSMRDAAASWRPIRKARRKKVFEKMDAPAHFYRPEIFATFESFAKVRRAARARSCD